MVSDTLLAIGGILLLLTAIFITGFVVLNAKTVTAKVAAGSDLVLGIVVLVIILAGILFLRRR